MSSGEPEKAYLSTASVEKQWACSWVGGEGSHGDTGAAPVHTPRLLFPGDVLELREGGEGVLIHGLSQEEHLVPLPWQPLHGGGDLHLVLRATGHVEDVLLPVLHPPDVLDEAGCVLGHTELDVGGELGPEGGMLAVRDPLDHVQHLPDRLKGLVLLQHLPGDVGGQVVTIRDSLDKAEVAGHHVLEVMGAEDPVDVETGVLSGLAVHVETLGGLRELEPVGGPRGKELDGIVTVGEGGKEAAESERLLLPLYLWSLEDVGGELGDLEDAGGDT